MKGNGRKLTKNRRTARSKVPRAEEKSDVGKDVESWLENQDEKRKGPSSADRAADSRRRK